MDGSLGDNTHVSRVVAALDWLGRSQDVTGCGGSAAYYTPFLGWNGPYPETSGYIIPTLWRSSDSLGRTKDAERAEKMARWLMKLQSDDGSFPGGILQKGRSTKPSIFNTGQIVFGLVEAAIRTGDERFVVASRKAANWLASQQDSDGRWTTHAYVSGYSPSYYAHVCWPLAVYWNAFGGEQIHACIRKGLQAVLNDQQPNGVFSGWGFGAGKKAFTHTIAYTLQGIIESALIVGDWDTLGQPAADSAEKMLRRFEVRHCLAGAYGDKWEGATGYKCLTGHCQLASTWMRLYERDGDPRYLNAAAKVLVEVCGYQRLNPSRPQYSRSHCRIGPYFWCIHAVSLSELGGEIFL